MRKSENFSDGLPFVKRQFFAADKLVFFVSLAREQDCVAGLCKAQRERRCPASVLFNEQTSALFVRALQYIADYPHRLLRARIVARDYYGVGIFARGGSHERALRFVPVAAAAEKDNELSAAGRAQSPQHLLEPVGRVSIVYYNTVGRAALNAFKPSADAL